MEYNFSSCSSLSYKACVAAVSNLWNQESVVKDIKDTYFKPYPNHKKWTEIENDLLSSVDKMIFPSQLKLKLLDLIQPMGQQILNWIFVTDLTFQAYADSAIKVSFVWTQNGVLDYIKTADLIIKSNQSYENFCFALACTFCMKGQMLRLERLVIPFIELSSLNQYICDKMKIISAFPRKDDAIDVITDLVNILANDVKSCSVLGYFLYGLSPFIKKRLVHTMLSNIFRKTAPREGNMLIFLFAHLQKSDIDVIMRDCAYKVLSCFLEWPSQEFFMSLVNRSWNFLSSPNYLNLLLDIVGCVSQYHASSLYRNMVSEFWQSSPDTFKQYIISKCTAGSFISRVFNYENTDHVIQIILENIPAESKQQLIFYHDNMLLCELLMKKGRWSSLKFFVLSCIPNVEVLNCFSKQYMGFKQNYCYPGEKEGDYNFVEVIKQWY